MKNFETRLQGGHPNSLGNTIEVVNEVLAENALFNELFECYFSPDEIVRLRTSNAMKRICKAEKRDSKQETGALLDFFYCVYHALFFRNRYLLSRKLCST